MEKMIKKWNESYDIDSGYLFEILLLGIIPEYIDETLAELILKIPEYETGDFVNHFYKEHELLLNKI